MQDAGAELIRPMLDACGFGVLAAFSAAFDAHSREASAAGTCLAGMRVVVRVAGTVGLEALRDASLQCLVRATALEGALEGGLQPKHEEAVRALLEVRIPSDASAQPSARAPAPPRTAWTCPLQAAPRRSPASPSTTPLVRVLLVR